MNIEGEEVRVGGDLEIGWGGIGGLEILRGGDVGGNIWWGGVGRGGVDKGCGIGGVCGYGAGVYVRGVGGWLVGWGVVIYGGGGEGDGECVER
uniref:Uncharacterized protein n=1 Tax=Knipowitschia caucasica TaxID=637954 RepID=A0AAV2MGK2_KNICA